MKKITVLLLFVLGFLSVNAASNRSVNYNTKYHGFLNPTLRGRLSVDQYRQALVELADGNYSKWQSGMGPTIRDYYLANLSEMKGSTVSVDELKSLAINSPVGRTSNDFQSTYWVASLVDGTGEINWYQRPPEGDECVLLIPGTNIAWTSIFCGNLLMPVAAPPEPDRPNPIPPKPLVPKKDTCCGGNQTVTVNGQPITITIQQPPAQQQQPPVIYQPPAPTYPSEITVRNKANGWDIANTIFNGVSAIANVKQAWWPANQNIRVINQGGGWNNYPQPQYPNNPFTPVNPGGPYSPPNGPGGYPNPGGPVSPPNGYPVSGGNGYYVGNTNTGGFNYNSGGNSNGNGGQYNSSPFTPVNGGNSGGFNYNTPSGSSGNNSAGGFNYNSVNRSNARFINNSRSVVSQWN